MAKATTTDLSAPAPSAAVPRDEAGAAFLDRWQRTMSLPIVLSAVVPLLLSPSDGGGPVADLVAVASWLVFLADLIVHLRCLRGYLRTTWGKIDVAIVVFTFPLYLLTGGAVRFAGLARLVRLVRVMAAARGLRHMFVLLNRVVIVAAFVLALSSLLVWQIEGPAHGFDSYSDSLWWGIVTITTVGYGDMVPQTTPGRFVAAFLMITGIGVVGALAGTLASALRLEPTSPGGDDRGAAGAVGAAASGGDPGIDARLARIEAQLDHLTRALAVPTDRGPTRGSAPDDRPSD